MTLTNPAVYVIYQIPVIGATANFQMSVPIGTQLISVQMSETTLTQSITGGIRIGTAAGGTDVVVAQAVAAGAKLVITDATLLKRVFSVSADTPLFIEAVTNWNGASLNVTYLVGPAY